jgi:radical SAM superfamily enzyme YgiQ (UPF0313 family)
MMKILFIRPCPTRKGINNKRLHFLESLFVQSHMFPPPLSFPTLAALTPRYHSITVIDERYKKINFDVPYDLVGITAMTNEAIRAYELADEFRRRDIPVVLGGPHVSALPDEAKIHADSVVIGEAEESWPQLLHDLKIGDLQPFYQQTNPTDLRLLPPPDNSFLSRYMFQNAVQLSRGCPYGCAFCHIGNSKNAKTFRTRPIDHIVQDIRNSKHPIITFYASSMTVDIEYTKSLFRVLKGLNKNFICIGNINTLAQDDELIRLSKEAGCIQWNIGFESISQESLNDVNKKTNLVQDYIKAIEKIHANKMNVRGYFIFGFDHDTNVIFEKTWEFIQRSHLDSATFSILTPLPATPLFKELENQHRIHTTNWNQYGYHQTVVFQPKMLTEMELLNGLKNIYQKYYSWPAIAKRFSQLLRRNFTISKLMIFLLDNIITRAYFLRTVCRRP